MGIAHQKPWGCASVLTQPFHSGEFIKERIRHTVMKRVSHRWSFGVLEPAHTGSQGLCSLGGMLAASVMLVA